jgi:N-acetylmuramoyl-L-alanine amidase
MIARPDSPLVAALRPSPNVEPRRGVQRPDMLLLHYTGMRSCAGAIDWLSRPDSRVSCHYVIDTDGRITQLVSEGLRAWHAGVSVWHGETDINSRSVGIEIHNPGHDDGYPDFEESQMAAVLALSLDIVTRHAIPAERVLGHSDVAPHRKIDPGEKLDWARLAAAGVGHWVAPGPLDHSDRGLGEGSRGGLVAQAQRDLARYGYGVAETGQIDGATVKVIAAFQRHFRPARVDGCLDRSTLATLAALLDALAAGDPPPVG